MKDWKPRHRITLQYKTRVPDGGGGRDVTWNDRATVFAQKTTHRSDEAVQAMMTTGLAVHNYRIRYRKDVSSSWRIKEGNRDLNIIGPPIDVEGKHQYLDITAKEAV